MGSYICMIYQLFISTNNQAFAIYSFNILFVYRLKARIPRVAMKSNDKVYSLFY